jgi:serine/threonine protein kinase
MKLQTTIAVLVVVIACAIAEPNKCVASEPPFQPYTYRAGPLLTTAVAADEEKLQLIMVVEGRSIRRADYTTVVAGGAAAASAEYVTGNETWSPAILDGNLTVAQYHTITAITVFSQIQTGIYLAYLMDNGYIRVIDFGTYQVATIAGSGTVGTTDGGGGAANFLGNDNPTFLAVAHKLGTTVYVTQPAVPCIRKVNSVTRAVSTVYGSCAGPTTGQFKKPGAMVTVLRTTPHMLYVSDDGTHRITKIDPDVGEWSTVARTSGLVSAINFAKDSSVLGLKANEPCKMYHVTDAELKLLNDESEATPAACVGTPSAVMQFQTSVFAMMMYGNLTSPLWGVDECKLPSDSSAAGAYEAPLELQVIVIIVSVVVFFLIVTAAIVILLLMRRKKRLEADAATREGELEENKGSQELTGSSLPNTMSAQAAEANPLSSRLKKSVDQASLFSGSEMVIAAISRGDFHPEQDPEAVALEIEKHNQRCAAVASGEYQKGKIMGRGANGTVFSVMLTDGSTIAMKEIGLGGSYDEIMGQTADVEREMKMLSTLRHPNIVMYYGAVVESELMQVKLFMELVTGGSLGSLVRNQQHRLSETPVKRFMMQIVEGLAFIHERGFVHRDLKAENVLIDPASGKVKLADFGTAKSVGNMTKGAQTVIGTPLFMAPEVIAPVMTDADEDDVGDEVGYGKKADVWSLGIMAAELLNQGKLPWPHVVGAGHAFMHISSAQGIPILPEGISDEAAGFIRRCTQREPKDRPHVAELKLDPWLSEDFSQPGTTSSPHHGTAHGPVEDAADMPATLARSSVVQ